MTTNTDNLPPRICIQDLLRIYDEKNGDWLAIAREVESRTIVAIAALNAAPPATAQDAGTAADGWALLNAHGLVVDFRPRVREFFGAILTDDAPEFDCDDIAKRDRNYEGDAPHRCVHVFFGKEQA